MDQNNQREDALAAMSSGLKHKLVLRGVMLTRRECLYIQPTPAAAGALCARALYDVVAPCRRMVDLDQELQRLTDRLGAGEVGGGEGHCV